MGIHVQASHTVDATTDVQTLVAEFKRVIGNTWAQATAPNTACHVLLGSERASPPWQQIHQQMSHAGNKAPHSEVQRHIEKLTTFYEWNRA